MSVQRGNNWAKFLAGPATFFVVWFLLRNLPGNQAAVGAVFAMTVVWWIAEPMPIAVTALTSTALLVLIGGVKEKEAFSAYGDPIVPLIIGSFILAKALEDSGLSERISWMILRQPFATRTPGALLMTLGIIGCGVSLFVSNTATTAMLLPIGLGLLHALNVDHKGSPFAVAVLLMLTWGSSVAVGFPVGTPPNLIGIGQIREATGVSIGFVPWMAFAMPITLLMIVGAWLVLRFMYGKQPPEMSGAAPLARTKLASLGPMSSSERNTMAVFLVALAFWIVPDSVAMILGPDAPAAKFLGSQLPPSVVALAAAALLFILPAHDRPSGRTMSWEQAKAIDWGTIMLFGGGIALGQAMASSGLAKTLGVAAANASGAHTLWTITALGIAAAILLSELASNTAAATTLLPVIIGIAKAAEVSPIPPALGVALGASLGFMLPVSTAPNAIVYSSGLVPPKEMMRAGIAIDIVGFFVTFGCLYFILPLLGLAG